MGSILDSNQIVALTEDDTQAPVMSSIKINLDQNGTMIEKVLVGPGKIESETLFIYLDQVVTVTVEIQSDIEVIFGVDYGDSISVSETCGGPISAYKLTHTYATIGVFNLSVEASNMVNNQSSFLSIETVYPINNIHFDDKSTPLLVEPDSVLLFDVIASGTSFPFGKTELMIECGANVTNETFTLTQDGIQTINCTMDEVGNHTIVVTIMSPLDRLELYRRDFRVWDNLTLFTFQPSAEAFAVGNLPSFNYTNPPVFNFDYVIDFGEGTILENNGIEHLRTRYTDITIPVLNYNTSGTYIVSFSASNHAYSKSMSTAVIFEYAIPPSNLQVDITDLLLVPPGLAKFSVYSDSGAAEITPTNVTCTYEFGDGVTITITNCCLLNYDATGLAIVVPYVFTTEGSMNVSFECENRVSSELMFAEVETKLMNVTLIEITHYEFLLMNNSDPITFDIQYNIFNFTIPPVNLTYGITWESTETMKYTEMTRLNDSHVYSVRGNNLLTIYFEYYSGQRTERKYIRSGTVEFILISSRIGQTDTTSIDFTVKRHLLSDDHSISIDWGDGSPDTSRSYTATTIPPQSNPVISTGAPTTESHVFIKAGIFTPVITFSSVRGIEILDLNDTIYIENKIQGLEISTEDRYTFADTIAPIISMGNTTYPVRNISCYFNYTDAGITVIGDLLDNSTDTIQTVIEYSDLGEKNLLVTCSNYLSEQTLQAVYLVFSVCFDSSRMFDRVYASVSTALKIYSSNPQTITGRSTITDVCKNRTDNIRYTWKLQRFNQSTSTLQDIAISHPNSISFTVLDFTSEPGIYRLELTVFFPEYPDDYITDVMFLQLIDPPLVGNIEFGSKREVSIGIPVNFDAKLSSFDPKIGHGIEDPDLRFSWNCYRIADSAAVDSYTAPYSNDTSYRSAPPCGFTLPSQSIINGIDTAGVQPNSWYLVELEVTKDVRRVTDIQVLYFSNADTPLLGISCQLNCLQKVLSDDITYFHSSITCPSCSPEQLNSVTYSWSVYKYNVITGQDDLLNWVDISSYISTVQSDREFNAKPFLFEEGASYAVELEATIPGKDPTKTTIRFDVNYRPYGGVCEFNTLTGFATVTKFQVTCDGWMDESFRRDRDALIDGGEPVVYRVEQFTRLGTFVVYEGSERSTPPFFLQPCDERDSYDCEVVVKIMDFVRSEANEKFIVNVQAPLDYYLSKARNETNSTDITTDEILEEFYQRIEQDINVTLNYDSFLIGIMTASTYGAVLNTIPLEQSPIEDFGLIQSNDSITARQTIVDSLRIIDPKKQRLQNVMEGVILLFTDTVNKTTRTAPLTLNDILIASSSLASLIDNPEIITGRAQSAISNTAEDLSNSLVAKLETSVIIKDILKTMEAINTLQDKVIDLGGPDMTGKLPNGVDYSNTDWNPEGDGFNPYEQEYFAKLINRRKAADIDRFIENAKETERVCEKIWENSFEIMDKATADNTTFKTINRNFASELTKGTIREILARQRAKTTIAQLMLGNQTGITEGQTGVAGSTESHTGVTGSTEGQTGSTEGQTGSTEGQTGSQTGNTDVQTGSTEGQTGGTGGPSGSTGSPGGQTASTDGSGGHPPFGEFLDKPLGQPPFEDTPK
ncbi:hypothetical protein LOTGIDRAFT_156606 [Lottia gigantea]|uniref:PKD/REJ-like domain-containing protein n=1 Tax=Lottia gigantea TaxID=225164 RepID=V4B142_LOTGI|nr:hypothetical protein LOTGIDRAFT_156606 [Lottia gigantea]ESP04003.1 hypothetical protein LOTGIDRAFT_156606 [Lottia gigantea]